MPLTRNPILPGFHPDPSIIRVGATYYLATSTFEWFPPVRLHTSTDLTNWTPIPSPHIPTLDLRGRPDSCGIWAPCLSHDTHLFHLVYTDVRRKDGSFKDAHNYLITAPDISGPWSAPIYLNSSGFDPSLFHDNNTGKKWLVNQLWDHTAPAHHKFAGIVLQEYDPAAQKLIGPRKNIFRGSPLGLVEGPHLYYRPSSSNGSGGWYYLLTAEGGTSYSHACTLARSRELTGPYELHPDVHILTSKDTQPGAVAIQKAGHGDLVDTEDGQRTFLVHLCGRPVGETQRCVLGRETSIQECVWNDDEGDGWLYVKNGPVPSLDVDLPGTRIDDSNEYWAEKRYTFESPQLHLDWQWLRTPEPHRIFRVDTAAKQLVLTGRESIGSWFEQALLARRQTHFSYDAETVLAEAPAPAGGGADARQFAGLVAYYCRYNFFYLTVTTNGDDGKGMREVRLLRSEASYPEGALEEEQPAVAIPGEGKVRLKLEMRGGLTCQFYYALAGDDDNETKKTGWNKIGGVLDASLLSDECGGHLAHGSFTGAFVGVACSDLNGTAAEARFDEFVYRPVRHETDRY